ncbi:SGNH/GDSL hydrolase family protein [Microlunatus soli]|uniref:Lysophospholipase L1 n=1 Tax=Microlunatus soli TaxID=630515 RepID=A0A1H1P8B1_9ACTN|nr:SGNH/GDSL hydrolase family protein [Microlunatus soli]SDS07481.1 Lysophospholipase L1 [Microlunatus soli]
MIKPDSVVVCYGDSITDAGRFGDPDALGTGYVRRLADRLSEQTVINSGVGGNRAVDLQARLADDVLAHRPDLVSIMIGINDTWRRFDRDDPTSAEDFERSYRDIATRITDTGAGLVLLEPFVLPVTEEQATAWREDLAPRIETVHRLATEFGAPVVALDAELNKLAAASSAAELAEDGVHPTAIGHDEIARLWLAAVQA